MDFRVNLLALRDIGAVPRLVEEPKHEQKLVQRFVFTALIHGHARRKRLPRELVVDRIELAERLRVADGGDFLRIVLFRILRFKSLSFVATM